MAKCKVCGREFTPCRTNTPLNWRRVACCAEHGAVWFEKIEAARTARPNIEPEHNEELQALLSVEQSEEVHDAVAEMGQMSEETEISDEEQTLAQEDDKSPWYYRGKKHR